MAAPKNMMKMKTLYRRRHCIVVKHIAEGKQQGGMQQLLPARHLLYASGAAK
jgi:hypothetical protein